MHMVINVSGIQDAPEATSTWAKAVSALGQFLSRSALRWTKERTLEKRQMTPYSS